MKNELLNQMKENYEKNDVEKCITNLLLLVMIYNKQIEDGIPYNHDLKHLLFKTNVIRNPMGMKYTKDDYEKTTRILIEIMSTLCLHCISCLFILQFSITLKNLQ